jgi:phosphatidylinositol alpha-mannosyltransferase
MRVMLSCPYSLSVFGGVQGQVLGLSHALRDLGVDARIVAPCDGPPPEPGITTVGPSSPIPSNGSVAPIATGRAVARRTLEAIRTFSPDVLHLHEALSPGANHAALLGTTIPAVGTFHSAREGRNGWYETLRSPLAAMMRRLAVRTAVSEEAQRQVAQTFGLACEIVPNGIEVARYRCSDVPAAFATDRPAILFVGRHEQRKGLEVLLDAFADLDRDAVLWVGGDGPQTAMLRKRAVPGVEWLGRVSDAEKIARLRTATIACFPALDGESFGVVLLEAMAAGAAVAASDIAGYRTVSRADREALLVPPGDALALRDALRRLLDDETARERLVAAGRLRADEFSMRRVAERFVDLYDRAIVSVPRTGVKPAI